MKQAMVGHLLAGWWNARGNRAGDAGQHERAMRFYLRAARCDPDWSVPHFNLGLHAKYLCRWEDCVRFNQRATQLNDQDEGAWWNLGIAATARRDWAMARQAWRRLQIDVPDGEGEWTGPPQIACVRLNPARDGEVVWGERLDPARLVILNVPLSESGHRFRDIVLHDGAANGRRLIEGVEVPVFDELQIWRASSYATYEVRIETEDPNIVELFTESAKERELGVEDWSSIRWICAACSRGNPGPHSCSAASNGDGPMRRFAVAARTESEVHSAVSDLIERTKHTRFLSMELLVPSTETAGDG